MRPAQKGNPRSTPITLICLPSYKYGTQTSRVCDKINHLTVYPPHQPALLASARETMSQSNYPVLTAADVRAMSKEMSGVKMGEFLADRLDDNCEWMASCPGDGPLGKTTPVAGEHVCIRLSRVTRVADIAYLFRAVSHKGGALSSLWWLAAGVHGPYRLHRWQVPQSPQELKLLIDLS